MITTTAGMSSGGWWHVWLHF